MLILRELRRDEAGLLARIDRGERIREEYAVVDGQLELHHVDIDGTGWHPDELAAYIVRLEALVDAGGTVFGAWGGDEFVGLASLDLRPVGDDPGVAKLDMLYVSRAHRGQGVGRRLTSAVADRAREHGAGWLYISATPTRGTVDAYLAMGAVLAPEPDPELLRLEPDDIHLLLPL